jgi:hypothetical protein
MCKLRKNSGITYVHSIAAGGLFTGVTFGKSPVEGVGKSIFTHVGENLIIDLESGKVGFGVIISSGN